MKTLEKIPYNIDDFVIPDHIREKIAEEIDSPGKLKQFGKGVWVTILLMTLFSSAAIFGVHMILAMVMLILGKFLPEAEQFAFTMRLIVSGVFLGLNVTLIKGLKKEGL